MAKFVQSRRRQRLLLQRKLTPPGITVFGVGLADGTNGGRGGQANGVGAGGAAPVSVVINDGAYGGQGIGWPDRPRKRVPVERLIEILKAQGSPWGEELGGAYEAAGQRLTATISPKHRETLETALADVSENVYQPRPTVDWTAVTNSLKAAASAQRATAAVKHAERVIVLLKAQLDDENENDDEEALALLLYG